MDVLPISFLERNYMRTINIAPARGHAPRALIRLCLAVASLPQNKNVLQEHCMSQGWSLPTYKTVGTKGPPHRKYFQVECAISDTGVWVGDWQLTLKLSQGSAAAAAISDLGITLASSPPAGSRLHPLARSDLLTCCDANGWPSPTLVTSREAGGGFTTVMKVECPNLPGGELGEFTGKGSRKKEAEAAASASALEAVRLRIAACTPEGSDGAHATLSALVLRHGLLMHSQGNELWIGGKPRVLRLAETSFSSNQPAPTEQQVGRVKQKRGGRASSPLATWPAWRGAAIGAAGFGMTRKASVDAASASVLQKLRVGFASLLDESEPSEGGSIQVYAPQQSVLATDNADKCNQWVLQHVLKDSSSSSSRSSSSIESGTPGWRHAVWRDSNSPRVRAVAIDSEWDASASSSSPSIIQVATRTACLVAFLPRGSHLPAQLRALLRSSSVAKVGKDLRQDWVIISPLLRSRDESASRGGGSRGGQHTSGWSANTCGWCELADFTPYHMRMCSMDALTRAWLGRAYELKGSVDHERWGTWPLSQEQLAYASGDVCAVIDVVHAAAASASLPQGPSAEERFEVPRNRSPRSKSLLDP